MALSASLSESNLGLLPAFPIFVRNSLEWAGDRDDTPGPEPPGAPATQTSGGRWVEGREGGPGLRSIGDRLEPVNFTDASESKLEAAGSPATREFAPLPAGKPARDPWRTILWAALVTLGLLWLLVARTRAQA